MSVLYAVFPDGSNAPLVTINGEPSVYRPATARQRATLLPLVQSTAVAVTPAPEPKVAAPGYAVRLRSVSKTLDLPVVMWQTIQGRRIYDTALVHTPDGQIITAAEWAKHEGYKVVGVVREGGPEDVTDPPVTGDQ